MPCPCHQLMYNPAMGSSSWGGRALAGGLPKFIAGLGSQVFPVLHQIVTLHQVLQDMVPGVKKLSFPGSGQPCSLTWTTATAPVTVGPGSLVRSAQSTWGQRKEKGKGGEGGSCFGLHSLKGFSEEVAFEL